MLVIAALALTLSRAATGPSSATRPSVRVRSSPDTGISQSNVRSMGTLWTAPVGFIVHSSPAVANGVVVPSLDAETASSTRRTPRRGPTRWILQRSRHRVLLAGGRQRNRLRRLPGSQCLRGTNATTGKQVWSTPTGASCRFLRGGGQRGRLHRVRQTPMRRHALDANHGDENSGSTPTRAVPSASTPAVANGVVYVGSDDGNVYALEGHDGEAGLESPYRCRRGSLRRAVVNGGRLRRLRRPQARRAQRHDGEAGPVQLPHRRRRVLLAGGGQQRRRLRRLRRR